MTDVTWTPPQFNVSRVPALDSTLRLAEDVNFSQNFARASKWCPDGSVLLTQCENRSFQLLDPSPSNTRDTKIFEQPAAILDFLWYPTASPWNPPSFCFLASVRECPVKLLDASDGRLRASYKIVDHRERQIAPHSLAFNLSGTRLYCGFEDAIEVFDISQPGEGERIPTSPSKKSKDGLKGIISALAFSPSYDSGVYAAGSLTPISYNIALFSELDGEIPLMFLGGGPRRAVTQLHFNPTKSHFLYASFRRTNAIYCWDIRGDVQVPCKVYAYGGEPQTNQKRTFDIDLGGNWLSIGDENGDISLFSLQDADESGTGVTVEIKPKLVYKAHDDTIGSVAFHPHHPYLLSASGSRYFDIDEGSEEDVEEALEPLRVHRTVRKPRTMDAELKLWKFGFEV